MEVVIRDAVLEDVPLLLDYATRLFSEGLPGICRRPLPTLQADSTRRRGGEVIRLEQADRTPHAR